MGRYRVGCMGWGYDDWVGPFYPPGTPAGEFLARYARVFDLTEVDSSFYRAPGAFLCRRWATTTPKAFVFSMKIPQAITHTVSEPFAATAVRDFLDGIEPIRAAGKLGPLVAQFPPSFRRSKHAERLAEVVHAIPRDYALAVELRNSSWWAPETFSLLEGRGAVLIWSIYPGVQPPYRLTGDFAYARCVGDRALTQFDRIQRDLSPQMEELRAHFEDEGRSARDIFVVLNNHFMGFGPGTAQRMQEVLGVPKADLSAAQRMPGQPDLGQFS